jgi:hypothetical protein
MFKLSNEALGSIMLALQKSLMEQSDIVPVLQGFDFKVDDKTGDIVKSSIREIKNELQQQKEELSNEFYRTDK